MYVFYVGQGASGSESFERGFEMSKVLVVRNEAQRVLIQKELAGQISDGFWENSAPRDAYKDWAFATKARPSSGIQIVIGENLGRNFYAKKSNYNFTNKQFLEWQSDDMLDLVQEETQNPEYDMKQLRKDLTDIKVAFKTVVAP